MGFFARFFRRGKAQPSQSGTPRACLPDAISQDAFILCKVCSRLRLTYEIRLATFMALESQKKLRLICPPSTAISPELRTFAEQHGVSIEEQA